MSPRVLVFVLASAVAVVMTCCSSSDDAPSTTPPLEAGPESDATTTGRDAAPDAPAPTASADFKSGTRLRAQLLTGDGVSLRTAWKDAMLGVDCAFDLAEDKALRCIPTAETLDGVTFSDAECKSRVHRGRRGCATKPTLARLYPDACGGGSSVHRLGSVVDTAVVYEKSASGCNPVTVTDFDVYPVTAALAPTELVAATTKQVTVGGGLAQTVLEAEDGAREVSAIYDVTRKTTCERGGGTKNDRCVPKNVAYDEMIYADMGCSSVAAYGPAYGNDCTTPPAIILENGMPGMCGVYEAQYAEVGTKVTTTPLFRKTATTCEDANITPSPFASYWTLGAAIPQTSLPALVNLDEGTGRLELRADATTSGRLRGRMFFDSMRKEECVVQPTSDGMERCTPIPTALTQPDEFSDDQCQKPIANAPTGCAPPAVVETSELNTAACAVSKRHFFAVGAKITPAQVYRINGTCMAGPPQAGLDRYDAATELPPSTFVALTRKTE